MDNPRADKAAKVDEIAEKLDSSGTVLVTEYRGLDVPAQAALRQAVRDAGGEYKIYKNTLTRIAAERSGFDFGDSLTGPTALAFALNDEDGNNDPVALSKALANFAKGNGNLVLKGGVMDGEAIDNAQIEALSKVPPREEMLAKFAGLLQAPMAKFAGLLQAMPRDMARLLKALVDKDGASGAPTSDTEQAGEASAEPAPEETDAGEAPEAEPAAEDAVEQAASEETEAPAEAEADDTENNEED